MNKLLVLLFSFVCLSAIGTFAQNGLTINIGEDEQEYDTLTPLIQAVKANNLVLVKKLVAQGVDLEETGTPFRSDDTPLDFAVKMNHQAIALFLLEKGAQSRNYLYGAILSGDLTWVKNLMAYKFDDNQAVMAAVESKNPQMLQFIVDQGFPVEFEVKQRLGIFRKRYVTPLDIAIEENSPQMVLILAKNGANLSQAFSYFFSSKDLQNTKSLIAALKKKEVKMEPYFLESFYHFDPAIVALFLQQGVDKNAISKEGYSALHISLESGNSDAINYCLTNLKLDINQKTTKNQTALMLLAKSDNDVLFHQLVDTAKSSINASDIDGNSLLFYVIEKGNINLVRDVLAKNPDINHQNNLGETCWMFALSRSDNKVYGTLFPEYSNRINFKLQTVNKVDLLGYLLNYIPADWETIQQYVAWGCNPKLLTKSGENLVNYLVRRDYCEAIPQALKWGVSIEPKNDKNEAPTMASFECVKALIDNGADVNAKGNVNFPSYLATAVNTKNTTAISYLLQKGANPNGTYMNSEPFIFQFIEEGNLEMLKLFVAYNADYKWKNRDKQNALDFAIVKSNQEIIAFLRSKGAKTTKESIEYEAAIVEEIKSVIKLIEEKNTTQIKTIWAKYPDMTFDEKTYKKLYVLSIEANDLELLEVLYDKKVNPNMNLNFEEQNAVHLAVLQSNLDLVTLLVAKGVDPNKTDAKGNKPIFYAKSRKIKKFLSNLK